MTKSLFACQSRSKRYSIGSFHSWIRIPFKKVAMAKLHFFPVTTLLPLGLLLACGCDSNPTEPPSEDLKSPKAASQSFEKKPSGPAPEGMVWVPGGVFWMGAPRRTGASEIANDMRDMSDSRPAHQVQLEGFWVDETEVTNAQFSKFVEATGYVTIAEIAPKAEDYPGAPPENLVPGSVVFSPPEGQVDLQGSSYQWWSYVPGANWKHPEGPSSSIENKQDHPVVHVGWHDAVMYAEWAKKRLPTEAEWEFAARGGLDRKAYVWGDDFTPENRWMANTFQGKFPSPNTSEDGFLTTSPIKTFPPNGYGLYDVAGNVWEWTSDWYRPEYYETIAGKGLVRDPKGPATSFDPAEPGQVKRVMKGGSFLCTDQYCSRYMPGGRGKGDPVTGTNHLGFRTVKSAE